jgi:hypothetical protein
MVTRRGAFNEADGRAGAVAAGVRRGGRTALA